ncbi:alkaline phosphatase family protein [Marivivens donghaensis]|uniref:Alkaline phosphatase family protein n=1 Tax=Marivivens donghaensis TaxID=1699413 RepID=A0ABX0W006_9RHOB|nr:alkaline phosphatase D family protein [Marivivens donghaensis]NIY72752.1 alkaline phosphatase family protein [Marivivens donghaensis]
MSTTPIIGPILFLDDIDDTSIKIAALFIAPRGVSVPQVRVDGASLPAGRLAEFKDATVWRVRFGLPLGGRSEYEWNGTRYPVCCDFSGKPRIAYVSCNGEEIGDLLREGSERNAMWARLRDNHQAQEFALLLHGGDQVYADEVTEVHALSKGWPDAIPEDPSHEELADLRENLREALFERYATLYASPEFAWLAARVPSLMQWDDHDICDGWGSLPSSKTHSGVGQTLFSAARESFLIFQHAAVDGDLPGRFADEDGQHLGWAVRTTGLRIVAPDLRSERSRRAVMGQGGWQMMEEEAKRPAPGHTFLMSSVPLLGPRLSILEALMVMVPSMQKYEDDLRDQWQSRAHRAEWRRMLRLVRSMALPDGQSLTVVSGEIHLATRGSMDLGHGQRMQQLVASGVAHRAPPKAWANLLGALSWLGDSPLRGHPIRIERLPGHASRYVAERNYLMLERKADVWNATWEFEESGTTDPLPL